MKQLILIVHVLLTQSVFSQTSETSSMQAALRIAADRVEEIKKSGYDLKGVIIRDQPCRLELSESELYLQNSNLIYVQAYSVVDKRSYYSFEDALKVFMTTRNSKDSMISENSILHSFKGKNNEIIDTWEYQFILPKSNYRAKFSFLLSFKNIPVEDRGTSEILQAKEETTFIILVYAKK